MATKVMNGLDLQAQRIQNIADPSSAQDAVSKTYVDNLLLGLRWKAPVRAATTANGTLATAYENGDTLDGVSLVTGDRILLKDQTTQTENGIYTVNASGAPTRATDADSTAELHGAAVMVTSGTVNFDRMYTQNTDNPTVGSSNIVWAQFSGGATYTADGQGIEVSANQFALELDGTSLSKSATGLRIGAAAAASGLTESSGLLSVGAGTGIIVNANDVAIDTSVVVRKFAVNCAAATSTVCNHNFGTKDVIVMVYRVGSPFDMVLADVEMTDTNNVTVRFATAPAAGDFRIVIHA